ncbi:MULTISPECIES: hypothetical protein [unclassified Streptomyces]|uniref:hypothetical protein n=1 Tax=unclassified Streptomyces TaxID=2593676 RepID=UPI001C22F816|nr:hypothetical protein [Streptomyces sp. AC558_RSS880]
MTQLSMICLVLAAVLLAMACVKADRVRAWRASLNPSAPDVPDAAFVVTRLVLVTMAVLLIVVGFRGLAVEDDAEWSADELTSAVEQAVTALDGTTRLEGSSGSDSAVDEENATMIEDEVVEHGGGDAPQLGVEARPTAGNTATDSTYTVSGDGAGVAFCVHVQRTRSKKHDHLVPSLSGGDGTTIPGYAYAVTSRKGAC